ncbi:MAG: alpha-L-fucosidase, partial [Planctomycetota bacterium]
MRYPKYSLMLAVLGVIIAGSCINIHFTCEAKAAAQPATAETVRKWQAKRFGMFIHWGPVSLKGTEIGWSRGKQVPTEEYDQLYKQFNPTKFDAEEWVKVAE